MRSLGEAGYRDWFVARVNETHLGLYLFCLIAQIALFASVGGALIYFSGYLIPMAIGQGILN